MANDTAHYFKREYNGARNFMTPSLVGYGNKANLHYEISRGQGLTRETIYGVTVLEIDHRDESIKRRPDLSACFRTMQQVQIHIDSL